MSTPLIGLSGRKLLGYKLDMPPGYADAPLDLYFSEYATAVARAGGLPVHLSPAGGAEIVDRIDALLLAGGEDVDPRRYGEAPGQFSGPFSVERDEFEFALVERALERGIPILGICRGNQLLNVALGGTLIQHLPVGEGQSHASMTYHRAHKSHTVKFADASTLRGIYGPETRVNSFHHQAVHTPGHNVKPVAWAEDGIIEAIEVVDRPIIGVQWHPENFEYDPIFEWLVAAAQKGNAQHV